METYLKNRILFDPTLELHRINGYRMKHTTWNEYQRLEAINPWELKKPFRHSRDHLVRLAGIKKGLYNPVLPTLRKISRDNVLCKLSDEHSRHLTCLDEDEFSSPSLVLKETPSKHFYDEFEEDFKYPRVTKFKNKLAECRNSYSGYKRRIRSGQSQIL